MSREHVQRSTVFASDAPLENLRALVRLFALQDVIMIAYLAITASMVWAAPHSAVREQCARGICLSMTALVAACFVGRGPIHFPVGVRSAVYRAGLAGVLISNYLALRSFLPLVRSDDVDATLAHLDQRLFGIEPALWLERFNQRPIVEWFSFFYFSYFFINIGFMLAVVWVMRSGKRTTEFALGTLIVFCVGQLGYTIAPAYGPVRHLGAQFHGELAGGFFWSCVQATVQAGGAMKDVFPSLHTAVPLWLTLFAARQSRQARQARNPGEARRWRGVAVLTGFFSANIIVSTMFLRWHYGIDVLAGVALAVFASIAAPRLASLEAAWRRALDVPGLWRFDAGGLAGPWLHLADAKKQARLR